MSKPGKFSDCVLLDIAVFSDPFPLTTKQLREAEEEEEDRGGWGPELQHFVGSVMHVFSSLSILPKKKKFKNRNLLVVYSCHPSATVAKSSMYFIFHFYVLCFFFFVHF